MVSISAGNPKTPTLDDLASDALDLRNATVVTRIVLDHCLAMTRRMRAQPTRRSTCSRSSLRQ